LKPSYAEAHANLGVALCTQRNFEEAMAHCKQGLQLKPDFAEAHTALGNVLKDLGQLEEAIACCREALRLKPNLATAHTNLGIALCEQMKVEDAVASFQQALRLQPDSAEAHKSLAMTWLLMGNFEQGWPEYEWRWKCEPSMLPGFRQPLWDGFPLQGRTILVYTEQGLGDALQFIRYAALVKGRGGQVLVACPASLVPLLASCPGIDRLIPQNGPLPHFDTHAPLLSLPGIFGTSLATVPANVPYLFADDVLIDHWRQELNQTSTFKIGIAWQGSPSYRRDRFRSIPLAHFAALTRSQGVHLLSLQKGPGTEQIQEVAGRFPVPDLGSRLDETAGAFMDTAAVMKNLELVITSDTAVAHLAGALGVPVWVALPFAPDFRWLQHREDSPWYPTMRLFRQTKPGDWAEVFERMAGELARKLAAR
jgi:ADP-heptose:LPS heptosyltransferase